MDIIIGAGISGLSYALFTKNDYLIIEQSDSIGGYCKTIYQDGFVWDYSGHFFHFQDQEIKDMVYRKIRPENVINVVKNTKIYYKGRMIDFPFQKNIHQLPFDEFLECLVALYDANTGDAATGKTFKDMVYSRYGSGIAEKFLIPYNEKLYACDLDKLDKSAMGRFFPKADMADIIHNFRKGSNASYNATFAYSKKGAIDYVNSIASNLNLDEHHLHLNESVLRIDKKTKTVYTDKGDYKFDNLVSTMPFNTFAEICGIEVPYDTFTCNKVAVLNLGFDRKGSNTDTHWIYFPDKELKFYRVGFYDNIMGTDRMSLYIEIGYPMGMPIEDEDSLLETVMNDLRKTSIVKDEKLLSHSFVVMAPAYVHINEKSTKSIERIKHELSKDNVYSIGRYGSWTYCSIEDNIKEARDMAAAIER